MDDFSYKNIGISLDLENWENVNDNFLKVAQDMTNQNKRIDGISEEVTVVLKKQIIDDAKLVWLAPVDTSADLVIDYPAANKGDTVMVRENGKVYRWDGNAWMEIQDIDPTVYNELDSRLSKNYNLLIDDEMASLGTELLSNVGWTTTGWSGDFATGWMHNTGSTTPLIYPIEAQAGSLYQVTLTVEDTDLLNSGFKFKVTIGNSAPFEMYQAVGSPIVYSKGIKAVSDGDFRITPDADFTGTVKGISVKKVVGIINPTSTIKDANGQNVLETRPTKLEQNNVYLGKNAGEYNTSGEMNTVVGHGAMENNLSGFWNVAMGYQALRKNINGSRNIALGRFSLYENISGARNVAVGSYALHRLTTGEYNVAIGADSGWYTTTGSYNISIGTVSLDKNTTGSFNTAIGYNALRDNETTSFNVAVGHHALRLAKQNNNTAVGAYALAENVAGTGQTAIGYQALNKSTGINNTAIGQSVLMSMVGGNSNTVIGKTALQYLTTGSNNTVIGHDGIRNLTNGQRNTIIGQGAGSLLTNGDDNILIGYNVNVPNAATTKYMSIGDLIYGDFATQRVGIGVQVPLAKLHIGAGTASMAPIRINSGPLLSTPAIHSIEYDGAFMYLTSSNGVRRKFTTEVV